MDMDEKDKKNCEMPEMPKIQIDEQFKALLPVLDMQTYAMLEESLLENGCMHPLVLWNGVLIDGHNRYEICTKHNIPFDTVEKEFGSREEVLIWIITTQVGRRNLTPIQLSYYRGLHYNTDKQMGASNQYTKKSAGSQNGNQQKNEKTVERLAGEYNVSPMTIMRDAQLAKAIDAIGDSSPEAKREILSGTAGITRQRLQGLAQGASEDEIKAIAETIEQGTYEKPKKAADVSPEAIFQGTCNECERYRSVHIQFTPIDLLEALNAVMAKMAQAYGENMRQLSSESDAAELRSALRGHIEMLEDLYRSI